jgi:hypothetical protein
MTMSASSELIVESKCFPSIRLFPKLGPQIRTRIEQIPFADEVTACDFHDVVLLLLQENLKAFEDNRDKNWTVLDRFSPIVQFVFGEPQ